MVYLEITLDIAASDRPAAAAVYEKFRSKFLDTIRGAKSKELLVRKEDVQVLHGFGDEASASRYLESALFRQDVVTALEPLLRKAPDVRIYAKA